MVCGYISCSRLNCPLLFCRMLILQKLVRSQGWENSRSEPYCRWAHLCWLQTNILVISFCRNIGVVGIDGKESVSADEHWKGESIHSFTFALLNKALDRRSVQKDWSKALLLAFKQHCASLRTINVNVARIASAFLAQDFFLTYSEKERLASMW